jgi:hypothetical protein
MLEGFVLGGFVCAALFWFLRLISPQLCDQCGAKAMPHTHLALVKAGHRIEELERALAASQAHARYLTKKLEE